MCVQPQYSGLQRLLDICGDYAAEREIPFNCNETLGEFFFVQKSINNLLHQIFLRMVYMYNFLTMWNTFAVLLSESLKDDYTT